LCGGHCGDQIFVFLDQSLQSKKVKEVKNF
jgi:hypothetical protein